MAPVLMPPRLCATAGYSVPVALLAGIVVAGVLGFIVGFASVRLREDFLAVTTIGDQLSVRRLCAQAALARRRDGLEQDSAKRPWARTATRS